MQACNSSQSSSALQAEGSGQYAPPSPRNIYFSLPPFPSNVPFLLSFPNPHGTLASQSSHLFSVSQELRVIHLSIFSTLCRPCHCVNANKPCPRWPTETCTTTLPSQRLPLSQLTQPAQQEKGDASTPYLRPCLHRPPALFPVLGTTALPQAPGFWDSTCSSTRDLG